MYRLNLPQDLKEAAKLENQKKYNRFKDPPILKYKLGEKRKAATLIPTTYIGTSRLPDTFSGFRDVIFSATTDDLHTDCYRSYKDLLDNDRYDSFPTRLDTPYSHFQYRKSPQSIWETTIYSQSSELNEEHEITIRKCSSYEMLPSKYPAQRSVNSSFIPLPMDSENRVHEPNDLAIRSVYPWLPVTTRAEIKGHICAKKRSARCKRSNLKVSYMVECTKQGDKPTLDMESDSFSMRSDSLLINNPLQFKMSVGPVVPISHPRITETPFSKEAIPTRRSSTQATEVGHIALRSNALKLLDIRRHESIAKCDTPVTPTCTVEMSKDQCIPRVSETEHTEKNSTQELMSADEDCLEHKTSHKTQLHPPCTEECVTLPIDSAVTGSEQSDATQTKTGTPGDAPLTQNVPTCSCTEPLAVEGRRSVSELSTIISTDNLPSNDICDSDVSCPRQFKMAKLDHQPVRELFPREKSSICTGYTETSVSGICHCSCCLQLQEKPSAKTISVSSKSCQDAISSNKLKFPVERDTSNSPSAHAQGEVICYVIKPDDESEPIRTDSESNDSEVTACTTEEHNVLKTYQATSVEQVICVKQETCNSHEADDRMCIVQEFPELSTNWSGISPECESTAVRVNSDCIPIQSSCERRRS